MGWGSWGGGPVVKNKNVDWFKKKKGHPRGSRVNVHVPGEAGGSAGMLWLVPRSGRLRVGGGQVFMLEILHYLLRKLCKHRFSQRFFGCLWDPGGEKQERGGGSMSR